jgi:hypothetical protein
MSQPKVASFMQCDLDRPARLGMSRFRRKTCDLPVPPSCGLDLFLQLRIGAIVRRFCPFLSCRGVSRHDGEVRRPLMVIALSPEVRFEIIR